MSWHYGLPSWITIQIYSPILQIEQWINLCLSYFKYKQPRRKYNTYQTLSQLRRIEIKIFLHVNAIKKWKCLVHVKIVFAFIHNLHHSSTHPAHLTLAHQRSQRTFTQLEASNRFNDLSSDATRYGQGRRNTKIKRGVEVWGSKECWNASTVRNDDADANH